jgi:hypothetical protein
MKWKNWNEEKLRFELRQHIWNVKTTHWSFLVRRCNLIFIINFIHIKYFYYLKKLRLFVLPCF